MFRWFALCTLPLLAGGCAQFELLHAEIQAARGEIAVVNRKVDSTRSDVQAVNQRLSQVGLKSGDEVSRTRADLQVSISQLVAADTPTAGTVNLAFTLIYLALS